LKEEQILTNAEKLVNSLKGQGYNAEIVDKTKGGLYRVSYENNTSKKEAIKVLEKIKKELKVSAWLLKK